MKTNSQNQTKKELKDPSVLPYYSDIMGIEDCHFTNPSKLTEGLSIPILSEWVVNQMGCLPTKHLIVSGAVLCRNRQQHWELVKHKGKIKPERSKGVLKQALYQPTEIEPGRNPTYRLLKSFAVNKKVYNAVVTINPVSLTYADCMEVVDWFIDSKMRPKAKTE